MHPLPVCCQPHGLLLRPAAVQLAAALQLLAAACSTLQCPPWRASTHTLLVVAAAPGPLQELECPGL